MTRLPGRFVVPALTALNENPYLSAIRAGMVAVVPLTIVGGMFMILLHLPLPGWDERMPAWLRDILEIPVTATFGVLAVIACMSSS